jgi:adenine-specific DNA glycosylase
VVPSTPDLDDGLAAAYRERLATWFASRGRQLAFRERSEPWGVLVSEVMAQQTQTDWTT